MTAIDWGEPRKLKLSERLLAVAFGAMFPLVMAGKGLNGDGRYPIRNRNMHNVGLLMLLLGGVWLGFGVIFAVSNDRLGRWRVPAAIVLVGALITLVVVGNHLGEAATATCACGGA